MSCLPACWDCPGCLLALPACWRCPACLPEAAHRLAYYYACVQCSLLSLCCLGRRASRRRCPGLPRAHAHPTVPLALVYPAAGWMQAAGAPCTGWPPLLPATPMPRRTTRAAPSTQKASPVGSGAARAAFCVCGWAQNRLLCRLGGRPAAPNLPTTCPVHFRRYHAPCITTQPGPQLTPPCRPLPRCRRRQRAARRGRRQRRGQQPRGQRQRAAPGLGPPQLLTHPGRLPARVRGPPCWHAAPTLKLKLLLLGPANGMLAGRQARSKPSAPPHGHPCTRTRSTASTPSRPSSQLPPCSLPAPAGPRRTLPPPGACALARCCFREG